MFAQQCAHIKSLWKKGSTYEQKDVYSMRWSSSTAFNWLLLCLEWSEMRLQKLCSTLQGPSEQSHLPRGGMMPISPVRKVQKTSLLFHSHVPVDFEEVSAGRKPFLHSKDHLIVV
jgi:hypothetical protein